MGYVVNDAIVVVGWYEEIPKAYAQARKIFRGICSVTRPTKQRVNGSSSFLIAPCGSKSGWEDKEKEKRAMIKFESWLRKKTCFVDWVHVAFGGDFNNATIQSHGDLP